MAISTEDEGTWRTGNGVGGEEEERFCVNALALLCFPRGVRWGYAPQTCAKETRLPGLSSFDSRRGRVLRGDGHSGITKTRPAPMSGGRTGRVVYQ